MSFIIELAPSFTDTDEDRAKMFKDAQEFALSTKEDDDFLVVPSEKQNELFEESSSVFTIDGKKKEFDYISSFNKNGDMISFGQDGLGLWWYFDRTGLTSGKNLRGPFRGKDKLLAAMEKFNA